MRPIPAASLNNDDNRVIPARDRRLPRGEPAGVGGGANPRINGGVFVTVHVALWSGIIRTSGAASWSPIVTGRFAPCKRWPSATASGG
jgi:hypothetical protein